MKKIFVSLLCLSLVISSFTVHAAQDISVYIDGSKIEFDVPPQIINDRTMVPMRALFEALGAEVSWDAERQIAIGTAKGVCVYVPIGEYYIFRNYVDIYSDAPAQIIDGRTMIPLRIVSESFGMNVDWNSSNRTITLTNSGRIGRYDWNSLLYYYGELADGVPNGFGILYEKSSDIPKTYGLFDPEYKLIVSGATFYPGVENVFDIGEFNKDGLISNGTMTYSDGAVFEGSFDNGYPSNGTMTFSNGDVFEGSFDNDGLWSNGTATFSNGDVFVGSFKNGFLSNGTMTYSDGDVFVGSFKNGQPSNGTKTFPDGTVFVGSFEDGYMSNGTMTFSDGIVFVGSFENGLPSNGTCTFSDGTTVIVKDGKIL